MLMELSPFRSQFTNLCKFTDFKFAVLKITVKIAKATHLQTYANSRILNLLCLNLLLKSQFTNLCKSSCLKSTVLKIVIKFTIYCKIRFY